MEKYVVYKHTNKSNGKVYIGITGQPPEKRWKNGLGYKGNKHFYDSIQKYGWDGFEHEVIEANLTIDEAIKKEEDYIRLYNSYDPEYGYNINIGTKPTQPQSTQPLPPNSIKIICVETNIIYESIGDAERQTHISRQSIYSSIKKGYVAKGLHFEKL